MNEAKLNSTQKKLAPAIRSAHKPLMTMNADALCGINLATAAYRLRSLA